MRLLPDINICYKIAFDAIVEKKEIQEMLDLIYQQTEIPTFIVGLSGELLTCASKAVPEFQKLNIGLKGTAQLTETLRNFLNTTDKNEILRSLPCCEDQKYSFAYSPVSIKGNIRAFYVNIYSSDEEMEFIREMASVMTKAAAVLLEEKVQSSRDNMLFLREFISKSIFDENMREENSLKEIYEVYSELLRPGFIIAVIHPRVYSDGIIVKIREGVCSEFQETYSYVKRNSLFILFTQITADNILAAEQALKKNVSSYRCVCGMTKLFFDIEMIAGEEKIALDALKTGIKREKDQPVFKEEDYCEEIFYSAIVEKYGKASYAEVGLETLAKEDELNGTKFYDTLKEYLLCGRNVGMTAEKMFIHRNTMIYRLTRIKEVLGENVNDPQTARKLLLKILLKDTDANNI